MTLPTPTARPDLLIIAGEHSGDQHAARLLREARAAQPSLGVCAIGGEELEKAGAQLLFDLTQHSVVGLFEVLKNYGFFKNLFEATVTWIKEHRPRAVCFVDYPGFNLRLAERLHKEGISVKGGGETRLLYYISPQIWAWKGHRRFKMAKLLDALAVIFPFEVKCYDDTDLPVTYVGHPFTGEDYHLPLRYAPDGPLLLLPGSRKTPVRRIFPLMLRALERRYAATRAGRGEPSAGQRSVSPDERAVAIFPSPAIAGVLEEQLAAFPSLADRVSLRPGGEVAEAAAVLTSSGTMSLNCALAAIPGAIVYRANPLTYFIGRRVVSIDRLGIANILLGRDIYPEYLQGAANPAALGRELDLCLGDPARLEATREAARELLHLLGEEREMSPAQWLLKELT
ncbi:lipid-A-disaccharide synthase [Ruficoccus amylovorans]|uniref:Lipid-A-disaccharide synthase n=1 Tax=Ruficoccus amylovorans TaxID=1804625 RepID=A0A842HC89_9BACT|nr:lipid-A-disaccharide synthase [Ruficoccus amylovorans]MBC2593021.1 lipid-A-disaccharide synthase [Ruficoccus amylovorans]